MAGGSMLNPRVKTMWCCSSRTSLGGQVLFHKGLFYCNGSFREAKRASSKGCYRVTSVIVTPGPWFSSLGRAPRAKEGVWCGWARRFSEQQWKVSSLEWDPGCSGPSIQDWFRKRVGQKVEESDCSPLFGKRKGVSSWGYVSHLGLSGRKRAPEKHSESSGRGLEHIVRQERWVGWVCSAWTRDGEGQILLLSETDGLLQRGRAWLFVEVPMERWEQWKQVVETGIFLSYKERILQSQGKQTWNKAPEMDILQTWVYRTGINSKLVLFQVKGCRDLFLTKLPYDSSLKDTFLFLTFAILSLEQEHSKCCHMGFSLSLLRWGSVGKKGAGNSLGFLNIWTAVCW